MAARCGRECEGRRRMSRPKIKLNRAAVAAFLRGDAALKAELARRGRKVSAALPGSRVEHDLTDRAVVRVILTGRNAGRRVADSGGVSRAPVMADEGVS